MIDDLQHELVPRQVEIPKIKFDLADDLFLKIGCVEIFDVDRNFCRLFDQRRQERKVERHQIVGFLDRHFRQSSCHFKVDVERLFDVIRVYRIKNLICGHEFKKYS